MISKRVVKEKRKAEEKQNKQMSLDVSSMNTDDLEKLIQRLEGK